MTSKYISHTSQSLIIDNLNNQQSICETINTPHAHGTYTFKFVSNAIQLSTIKIQCFSELNVNFKSSNDAPLRFIYCHEGDLNISLGSFKRRLSAFQNAILFEPKDIKTNLKLNPNTSYQLSIISINRNLKSYTSDESDLLKNLIKLVTKGNYTKSLCHVNSRNLAVSMMFKDLETITGNSIAERLIFAGKLRVILGTEYQQLVEDLESKNQVETSLTRNEIHRLSNIIEKIKTNPSEQYTVSSLSIEAGISENKLQEGFKNLFGRTVTDCIRNIRLEKAENLLKTTDLNVSEVVYSVGFISRSYFSKIFKAKYNCSPSSYKKLRDIANVA